MSDGEETLPVTGRAEGSSADGHADRAGAGARAGAAEPRARVRVVRPGGSSASATRTDSVPPMPVGSPTTPPPWLDPTAAPAVVESAESGLEPEERELRELFHRAVVDLQPVPGALEQLRRAVPRRRLRRRQLYGTVAATAALCVIGGFVLHSTAVSVETTDGPQAGRSYGSPTGDRTAGSGPKAGASPSYVAGFAPSGGGGTVGGGIGGAASPLPGMPGSGVLQPSGNSGGPSGGAPHTAVSPGAPVVPSQPSTPVSTTTVKGSASTPPLPAECGRTQLGGGTAGMGPADSAGVVYGTFQVTNVSGSSCTVSLQGTVTVQSATGTDPSAIAVVQHTAGDPAGGLPAPSASPAPVLLAPGKAYAVGFAWVPASGSTAPGCTAGDPSGSGSGIQNNTADDSSATGGTDGGTPGSSAVPPTVTLAHTPGAGGGSAASIVLSDACAGTVYRTAPLPTG